MNVADKSFMEERIELTSPLVPELDEFCGLLKDIFDRRWLSNCGKYHQILEKALCEYLKVPYLSLYANGTLPLITALNALDVKGEVITTPFTFVATSHAIVLSGSTPVFADIDPLTYNLDPDKIEAAISPRTTAIMPVHCYGTPCDTVRIQEIADRHGLKVIYDAAHAFGVEVDGRSILEAGDMSAISFHATKVYNTVEGGALVCKDKKTSDRLNQMRNFGIASETEITELGQNAKMDEVRAAFGLLNLAKVDNAILQRKRVAETYRSELRGVSGISVLEDIPGVKHNYAYFPIFIDAENYGMTRDELYFKMREANVVGRRYFYPLISELPMYRGLDSAASGNLPIAHQVADSVLCLPIHHELSEESIHRILNLIIL